MNTIALFDSEESFVDMIVWSRMTCTIRQIFFLNATDSSS